MRTYGESSGRHSAGALATTILLIAAGQNAGGAETTTVVSTDPRISMTIYNSNLALIEEVRTLDPGIGRARLELRDVSA
ncbi:MAG: hypothetical protein GX535_15605, partial [Xanthomonadaceae bacterium]|nr:hypothetical protein [Xanthomonadaceae bacterium]